MVLKHKKSFKLCKKPKGFSGWWRRYGSKWITLETIVITIFIIVVLYLLCTYRSEKDYGFKGLSDTEIKKVSTIPIRGVKVINRQTQRKKPVWKREEMCRSILENIYKKSFPSVRPAFLKSPATGKNLELDCYNSELKLAVEHDGEQHSRYSPYFHKKGPTEFTYQVVRDDWKNMRCKQEGITLIRVPHWVPEYELEKFIRNKLREVGKL